MDAGWADWQSAGKGLLEREWTPPAGCTSLCGQDGASASPRSACRRRRGRPRGQRGDRSRLGRRPTTSWRSRAARLQEDPRHPLRGSGPPPRWVVVIGVGLNVNNKLPKALGEAAPRGPLGHTDWRCSAPGDPATAEEVPGLPRGPNGHIEYPLPLRLPSREMKDLRGRAVLVTGAQRDRLGDRPPSPEGCRLAVRAPREQARSFRAGAREGSESFELARRARPDQAARGRCARGLGGSTSSSTPHPRDSLSRRSSRRSTDHPTNFLPLVLHAALPHMRRRRASW